MGIRRALRLLSLIKNIVKNDYESASDVMGRMHGLPQKLGQHFTLYQAPGFDRYFEALCTESRPEYMPVETILEELGLAHQGFSLCAQASIGQVYRVATGDGILAVKIRYPDVEKRIRHDLRLLRGLVWPTRFLPLKNSSLRDMIGHLESLVLKECDYSQEAATQQKFFNTFKESPKIGVPEVVASSQRAIASRWVDGRDLRQLKGELNAWFVKTYLTFLLKSLINLGMVHGDPNPGNFIISDRENSGHRKMWVVDYGSTAVFEPHETKAVVRLLSGEYENEDELTEDLVLLGMSLEALNVYRPIIGDLVSILLEPFYYPGEFDFRNWRLQYRVNTLLSSRTWERPLSVPLKLLLLLRALHGLYYYARSGSVVMSWREIVEKQLR